MSTDSLAIDGHRLAQVFGPDSAGDTPRERARTSQREYVRSQVQLALAAPEATGRRLTAMEALDAFGFELLEQVALEGSASLTTTANEPAATLASRRKAMGLSVAGLAKRLGVPVRQIEDAETPGKLSPIRLLETIAQALALDERALSLRPAASGDAALGVRLRELTAAQDATKFSEKVVIDLSEAAWVIGRQNALANLLGEVSGKAELFPEADYDYAYPTWERGFRLAAETRRRLGYADDEPVESLRHLIEVRLGIPVVQQELGQTFAGATLSNSDARGIVVNLLGMNENVWVRRMTLCHELGHLLWDPNNRLNKLAVDRYAEIENPYANAGPKPRDVVEIRANAFAIAFLVPPVAVERIVDRWGANDGLIHLMEEYGIGATAARAHIENVTHVRPDVRARDLPGPSDEWVARESYAVDYFPVRGTPYSRTGRFASLVARAALERRVSLDSAASMLATTPAQLEPKLRDLVGLHV